MGKPRQPAERTFHSGDKVAKSGLYAVAHDGAHRHAQCILLLAHDTFPACGECRLTFRLLRAAPYIFEDDDFRPGQTESLGPKRVK